MLTGCASPTVMDNPQPVADDRYDAAFEAGREVLRDAGFVIDRSDYRFGRITTRAKGSPTLFEPWIGDNRSPALALQSTLGDLRRTVTIFLETPAAATQPAANAGGSQGNRGSGGEAASPRAEDDAGSERCGGEHPGARRGDEFALRVEVLLERRQRPTRRMTGRIQGSVFDTLDAVPREYARRGIEAAYWEPVGRDLRLEQHLLRRIMRHTRSHGGAANHPGSPGPDKK